MTREEFYKDKDRNIAYTILRLGKLCRAKGIPVLTTSSRFSEHMTNQQVKELRNLTLDLNQQVHELNAGRNIFKDNDKDKIEE